MTDKLLRVLPCRPADMPMLTQLAKEDGHAVIAPTWLLEKNQQVIGYIGTIPSVLIWLDRQKATVRDSVAAMNFFENQLFANGAQIIGVPCVEQSPLKPYMTKAGYTSAGHTSLFLKNLNP